MTYAALLPVLLQGVLRMHLTQRTRQALRRGRNQDKMDVIRHKTPTQNADVVAQGVFAKQFQVAEAILWREEDVLAVVSSLGNVMRYPSENESRSTGHAG
jgi:hypothetical protein